MRDDQVTLSGEPDDACDTHDQAVDRERRKGAGLEVPGQESDRKVGGESGGDAAEDDRCREKEGESCGLLVVEASPEPGDHRDAGATDAGEQGEDLRAADLERV